jgi:hypothetical protein
MGSSAAINPGIHSCMLLLLLLRLVTHSLFVADMQWLV